MSRNTTVTDDKELMEMIKQDMQQQPTTANTPEPDRMEQAQKNIFSDVGRYKTICKRAEKQRISYWLTSSIFGRICGSCRKMPVYLP